MLARSPVAPLDELAAPELLRAAFRDLHATRLHGFALLVTAGDRPTAARIAREAVDLGAVEADRHRHPERAAAWLRAQVLRAAPRDRAIPFEERAVALDALGVDRDAIRALLTLSRRERAAIVAADIERLDSGDVATAVGRDGRALDALLRRARTRYLERAADADAALEPGSTGPIAARVLAAAARAWR